LAGHEPTGRELAGREPADRAPDRGPAVAPSLQSSGFQGPAVPCPPQETRTTTMPGLNALDAHEAREFAERWLPAWTGNDPERLASFYADDAYYADPAIPNGVRGRAHLLAYFRKLLARYPDWVWTQRGSIPLADGFLNEWHASIPVGPGRVELDGVCTVQLRANLIYRNEVYFDRSALLGRGAR
jgi:hypothetical protein